PQVIDDEVRVLRVLAASNPGDTDDEADPLAARTVATLVNFGSHPEYLGSSNTGLSSDWPHFLRRALEEGVAGGPVPGPGEPLAPVGGVTVFVRGAIGSQIGPNDIAPRDWDGAPVPDERRARTEAVGTQLGALVLQALHEGEPDLEERPELAFRRARLFVPVANRLYRYAGEAGIMQRSLYNYDPDRRIDDRNVPDLQTEVAVLRIGRAAMLTVPGELDPVEWIGGYAPPCPYTPGGCDALVDEDAENPPDLARAPAAPYLRDRLATAFPEATELWLLGMTNDFLGYFIPEFDFEVDPVLPYLVQAPGAHYEETNSVGPEGWPRVRAQLTSLLRRD
ncbi:MAG TPA: hypothetical protein RMH80_05310, partial [Polyangiaceae bacterium LLY-WYZ-15_(1-7)]|nr:hypothetical protein [Polyangiaceae bacterium LLY-WYZ-15_(1-7)]